MFLVRPRLDSSTNLLRSGVSNQASNAPTGSRDARGTPRDARPPTRAAGTFAWHGLSLSLPPDWHPLKLEGDRREGYALFADLERPRLGLRWKAAPKRGDPAAWVADAMRREVGRLAAAEAVACAISNLESQIPSSLLYAEPDPPGRDVWVGHSAASNRLVQVICHVRDARRRGEIDLAADVLPTLADAPPDGPRRWSVFELSCVAPAGYDLADHALNAGDLSLTFAARRSRLASALGPPDRMTVRQVAVASVALGRRPIAGWVAAQREGHKKFYRLRSAVTRPLALHAADGRPLVGLSSVVPRRRRYGWGWRVAPRLVTIALHDAARDRLLVGQGHDRRAVRRLLRSVGPHPASVAPSNGRR